MSDLSAIRQLIRDRMLENGGGSVAETYSEAARTLGCSQPTLYVFLNDEGRGMDVEMCLRVARYLSLPASTILRLANHTEIADMLSVPDTAEEDAHVSQLRRLMVNLNSEEKATIVSTARSISKSLRLHHITPS